MTQWYLASNGQQWGPLDLAAARAKAREIPDGYCWRAGYAEWVPIANASELSADAPVPVPATPPPAGRRTADVVDYRIYGEDMQFVEIELDPGEAVVSEAGAMMYKDAAVQMETIFGDGSHSGQGGSFVDQLLSAGKRVLSGEGLFITMFVNSGGAKAKAAFAAPFPGTIIPLSLSNYRQRIICQKDSFLCAARGASIGIWFQKKFMTGLFGGEGFIMQKIEGDGVVFMHAGGTVVERELAAGETIHVDTGCVVAFTDGVGFDVRAVGGVKSVFFGGEGVFFAELKGPGHVWLQSLPFSRLAGRMLMAAYQRGGSRDEGSVLGGLGGIISGDRRF